MDTANYFGRLTGNWWVFVLEGIVAVLFGIGAWVWPGITLEVLVALFGAFALVEGVLSLVAAFRAGKDYRWQLLLWGLVGIAAGVVTFMYPQITALALVYVIAVWAITTGIVMIWAAVALRREIEGEWLLGLTGVLSIAFGILVLLFPGSGALSIVWMIGVYAVLAGVALIALGLRLRRVDRITTQAAERAGQRPAPGGPAPASG